MLTKLRLALLLSAPLVAGATTYAVAGGDGMRDGMHKDMIQKFDKNADGTLDDAERAQMKAAFEAKRAERHQAALARFNRNQDGTLDDAERAAMRDARLADRFKAMDVNGDGAISLDEFKAGAEKGKGGFHHGRHGHGRRHGAGMKP